MKKNKSKKISQQLIALIGIFILLVIIFIINNQSINHQLEENPYQNIYSEKDLIKIKGEFSCLPPKYPDRPHHDLCAFGLKEGDNYYQLQVRSDDEALKLSALSTGDLLEIEGYLLEEESQIYQSLGTIEVLKIDLKNKQDLISSNLLNCNYIIDDQVINLMGDHLEEDGLSSNPKAIYRYFGNEVSGDFNGDGFSDTAFILSQDLSGSGTFYYLAVALFNEDGCKGTNAILLGNRISPQTTNFQDGKIIINFAERRIDEPMTNPPSIAVSKYFIVNGYNLVELNQ